MEKGEKVEGENGGRERRSRERVEKGEKVEEEKCGE